LRSLAAICIALEVFAAPAGAAMFEPDTFTLANGMQVVVIENHRAPVVVHMIWYKAGSADEPVGSSGVAHFLEHLMFKATETMPSGEFSRVVARNGGRDNAFTSYDYTAYVQTLAADRLPLVMEMEADRMRNLVLADDEIETERLVVLEERRSRTDNDPASILREHVNAALYLNHPYRIPIIGWAHEVQGLDRADIAAFYRRHYAPNNAVLAIAGDVTADAVRPLAEKYYGAIPAQSVAPRARPQEPPQNAERTVVLRDARVTQPSWSRSFLAPSYTSGATEHAYALQILSDVLGGGATSHLYRSLVVERKLATNAGSYYGADSMGPSRFVVFARPRPGVDVDDLAAAVEAEIGAVRDGAVTDEDVDRAKKRLRAESVYARDSLRTGARILGAALASGRTIADVEAWPDRIGAVTADQVRAAARIVFAKQRSVIAILLPAVAQ
jgi:zinc protease